MAFSINGRIYHSSLGLALIVLGPAGRRQLRQGLGSHDIFTIKSSASLGTLFFHKYFGSDILLDTGCFKALGRRNEAVNRGVLGL